MRWGGVSSLGGAGGHTDGLWVSPSSVRELCSEGVRAVLPHINPPPLHPSAVSGSLRDGCNSKRRKKRVKYVVFGSRKSVLVH